MTTHKQVIGLSLVSHPLLISFAPFQFSAGLASLCSEPPTIHEVLTHDGGGGASQSKF
jgi:hypothetical protein